MKGAVTPDHEMKSDDDTAPVLSSYTVWDRSVTLPFLHLAGSLVMSVVPSLLSCPPVMNEPREVEPEGRRDDVVRPLAYRSSRHLRGLS